MTRTPSATERLQRLLSLVPYVAERPGGVEVDEVCRRFALTRQELVNDLETVMMVGVYPFTPDTLIDAWIENDRVMIHYADAFARPLRLTSGEAINLLAAARGVQELPDVPESRPLASALDKLTAVLGSETVERLDVDLGHVPSDIYRTLEGARDEGRQVEIDYRRPDAEAHRRRIEVSQIFFRGGHWYVSGWCHRVGGNRVFRVDRILSARLGDDAVVRSDALVPGELAFDESSPQVELVVDRAAAWLFESVPVLERIDEPDRIRLRLAIGSPEWLARTLVQLGSAAEVVSESEDLDANGLAREFARSVLERYDR